MPPLCLCQQVENQQTMTTVHCRQTSRDVNIDVLDNKLAGFEPADLFPWHARRRLWSGHVYVVVVLGRWGCWWS